MHISMFANELVCQHGHKIHGTEGWPTNGDMTPFFFQKQPSNHSLQTKCPHCKKDWYVVWDNDPGAIQPLTQTFDKGAASVSKSSQTSDKLNSGNVTRCPLDLTSKDDSSHNSPASQQNPKATRTKLQAIRALIMITAFSISISSGAVGGMFFWVPFIIGVLMLLAIVGEYLPDTAEKNCLQPESDSKPAQTQTKNTVKPAPDADHPPKSLEEFARRATLTYTSTTLSASEITQLIDILQDALREKYPHLGSIEAFNHALAGLSLQCPKCGQFSEQATSRLYFAGSELMKKAKGAVFGGPNAATLAQCRCPGCGGSTIIASFNPQKLESQLEAAEADVTAAKGMPNPAAVCPSISFFGSLAVSPDEELICYADPGGLLIACESGTDRQVWSLNIPSAENCLCRFVGPERLLVISEKQKEQTLLQLINTTDGSVVAEILGPAAYYDVGQVNLPTGSFVGKSSYDTLLTIETANDDIQFSTCIYGQISSEPSFGPDGRCYTIFRNQLYRIEGDQKQVIMQGSNCLCFQPPDKVYCGGGYPDRSDESNLYVADLRRDETSKIPWGNEPINEIALAGKERLLIANTIDAAYNALYPNATLTLFSVSSRKAEWSLAVSGLKPGRSVILETAPKEGWTLIQTGSLLKLINLEDGHVTQVLPKQSQEIVTAQWLASKSLLYIARKPSHDRSGMLECYSV